MGIVLPMVVQEIYNGNELGERPRMNIKGYLLGNPLTDRSGDYNSRIPFAHSKALLSDEIYKEETYSYSAIWANRRDVRKALHIREEFDDIEWVRCNDTMTFDFDKKDLCYTHNVVSSVNYHQRLADRHSRALIYSGDHDMMVRNLGTIKWIGSLNLYTMKYSKNNYNLTYATVKGGGHTAPEYKPKECLSMLVRWLANDIVDIQP
ncbi:serine carboxypeptidase-like 3 [Artemisia annua]|uniref:Serine carboxypeptidase-like 3 n=1 Tax=Artemisia annua TaxID=35608 RepID=A0A2U1QFF1_ARTAN|nr:serine carboxypeptidase-like 3 [Artemisia annua]